MPKYLLLKHYRGGPEPHRPVPPMDQWAPEDVEAHITFQRHVSAMLEENGEYVGAEALTPARTWVRYGGEDAAPVTTDGPLPETSDLVAGWFMIDVESHQRALEVAADDPLRQDPAAVLGRAVAVGHVRGAAAGLRETDRLRDVLGERQRWHAVRGHLHELDGDLPAAATAYAEAARRATNVAERDHLVRQAARARAAEL
jgi:hypothetical protein